MAAIASIVRPSERVPARDDRVHRHRVLQARPRRDQGSRGDHPQELEKRLPDFDTPITINVNGCPNSCARFQVADIGFKGMVTSGPTTASTRTRSRSTSAAEMGTDAEFGRKFRGLKVTAEEAPDYAERVLRGYLDRRRDGESFAAYVTRAEEEWLT